MRSTHVEMSQGCSGSSGGVRAAFARMFGRLCALKANNT